MSDFAEEIYRLQELSGADFIAQLKLVITRAEFHPLDDNPNIFIVGGEHSGDYHNLLNAAKKAVAQGYNVFILPNPKGKRTADFIFEQKGNVKMYDLKTIQGASSVSNRLKESIGQSNRVLLNIRCSYNARLLAMDIKMFFQLNSEAIEVLIFKGRKSISVSRYQINSPRFDKEFRKQYEK